MNVMGTYIHEDKFCKNDNSILINFKCLGPQYPDFGLSRHDLTFLKEHSYKNASKELPSD